MELKDYLTIIVSSCDAYSDIWDIFFSLLDKYWPNCNCDIILNTETKNYSYKGLNISTPHINKTKVTYGKRMINCLKTVKTRYCLLICDDYFIRNPVNTNFFKKIIGYLEDNKKNVCFRLVNEDCFNPLFMKDSPYDEFYQTKKYVEYKLNYKCSLWRTEFLLKSWKKCLNPWTWESQGTYRYLNNKSNFYILKENQKIPFDYGYQTSYFGLVHGLWCVGNVNDFFKKEGIFVDYKKRGIYPDDDRFKKYNKLLSEIIMLKTINIFRYLFLMPIRIYIYIKRKNDETFPPNYIVYKATRKTNV